VPWNEVMHKWGQGSLRSGGPGGPKVKNQKQAVAIMLSEKRKAAQGNSEYKADDETHPFLKAELGHK
jgi:hypothetical protein